jgi:uncharacterized membrane protein
MASKKWTLPKVLPYVLLVGGIIGYICSFIIMFDKVKILQNPHYIPSCSLNPIVSCGSVMQSKQAAIFHFPNPFIGLGGFPVVAVIGGAMLAGGKFKRWFWLGLETGLVLGLAFAYWLLFESVYRIHALCPYCLMVDVVMITVTWYTTLYIIDSGYIKLQKNVMQKGYGWIRRHHLDLLVLWFLILIALILKHFWYYFGNHLF